VYQTSGCATGEVAAHAVTMLRLQPACTSYIISLQSAVSLQVDPADVIIVQGTQQSNAPGTLFMQTIPLSVIISQ
jgi:hypothetical protein